MRPERRKAVLFLAGDLSGDAHSARLAAAFGARNPACTIHALGGKRLGAAAQKHGGTWIGDTTNCSAIGLHSVIPIYFWARWLSFKMRQFVRRTHIDAAVLCDWGGFTCRQLRFFEKAGVPLLYYFPPGSWRQKGKLRFTYATRVRRIATPFKWSADHLRAAGASVEWVGHPIIERDPDAPDRDALRAEFGVRPGESLIALLPGSRVPEVRVIGPSLAGAAEILRSERAVRFVVPVPGPLAAEAAKVFGAGFQLVSGRASDVLRACDAAVVKTGSATLEAAAAGAPQVAVYDLGRIGRLEWLVLWSWKEIPFIAMPNIILQRRLVTELLGPECRPQKIAAQLRMLLDDPTTRERIDSGYAEIRTHLGGGLPEPATLRTARMLEELLDETP